VSVPLVPLGEVAHFNPPVPKDVEGDDREIAFVPMAAVSESGTMRVQEHRVISDISGGLSYFQSGDILLAKITPCYENNKIVVADIDRTHGFGSTEFHVIRPDPGKLDSRYLCYFLRQDGVRRQGTRRMTGSAGQRRVPKAFLEQLFIPLPPLDEQRRIAAILDQADALRRKRQEELVALDRLVLASFFKLFKQDHQGRSFSNETLEAICDLVRGSSPRPQGDPRFFGGPVPRLMIADITRDGMVVTPTIDSLTIEGAKRSRPMPAGSVVMAVSGAVGLPAILAIDACIHDGFVGFRSLDRRLRPEFFYYWLLAERAENSSKGTGAIWVNLNTDQVRKFMVPIPPMVLQEEFAEAAKGVERQRVVTELHMANLDALFASLQHRAFNGQL